LATVPIANSARRRNIVTSSPHDPVFPCWLLATEN
jgi:hypothetical protein